MAKLTNEEMKEIMETLEKSGMNPRLCNTPVPYYDVCVQAGVPTDPGYIEPTEMVWMSNDSHKIAQNRGSTLIKGRYFTYYFQQLYADEESFFIGFFCA